MEKRKTEMKPFVREGVKGYLKRYSKMVSSADKGAVIE